METLGYLIATPIMLLGLFAAMGVRKPLVNLAYTAGAVISMYLFFQEILDVVSAGRAAQPVDRMMIILWNRKHWYA